MGIAVNRMVGYLTSPLSVALTLVVAGLVFLALGRRRGGMWLVLAGTLWLWIFSTGFAYAVLGGRLERMYPPQRVEDLPEADAVVVLGGGVGADTNSLVYAELFMGADRVLHAARIVKAGKAPVVIASGEGEREASLPLLKEFGVPEEAILIENESRNTEENARYVAKMLADRPGRRRVLLVTSSWHMRRALLMFRRHAGDVEVVPAPIDYEGIMAAEESTLPKSLLPSADMLMKNSFMLKEYVGYWGYRLFR